MFDGLGTELNSIIDNLCVKLGTTADALIPELCKYKVYQSIGYITAFSIILASIIITMLILFLAIKKVDSHLEELIVIELFMGMALFVFIGCITYSIYSLIIWKNAPTGAAVNYLIQQLRSY